MISNLNHKIQNFTVLLLQNNSDLPPPPKKAHGTILFYAINTFKMEIKLRVL